LPSKPTFEGTTPLPDLKPPPDFSGEPPSKKKPDEGNSAGGASDNPYTDDEK
jgi:hypothetical protein